MNLPVCAAPPAEYEVGTCRYCAAEIRRIPGGWWGVVERQYDLWGPMYWVHCPGRGLLYGFRQGHVPRAAK